MAKEARPSQSLISDTLRTQTELGCDDPARPHLGLLSIRGQDCFLTGASPVSAPGGHAYLGAACCCLVPVGIYLGRGVMGKKAECERKGGEGGIRARMVGQRRGEHRGNERKERRGRGETQTFQLGI